MLLLYIRAVRQQNGTSFASPSYVTLLFTSCVLGLTSSPGFPMKSFTGFNPTTNFPRGMTGQSSMRGICVDPNVCTPPHPRSLLSTHSRHLLSAQPRDSSPAPTFGGSPFGHDHLQRYQAVHNTTPPQVSRRGVCIAAQEVSQSTAGHDSNYVTLALANNVAGQRSATRLQVVDNNS